MYNSFFYKYITEYLFGDLILYRILMYYIIYVCQKNTRT